jgi:5-formyltetrahydrofolate cyclo-ligase
MPPDDRRMTKAELRREMRQRLRALGPNRAEKSQALTAALVAHPAFLSAERVALFSPLPSEPDVETLWTRDARRFCYPRVCGSQIEFVDTQTLEELLPSAWHPGVREPAAPGARIIPPSEIDLILVPGLAFTRTGWRLGRGGGFYDRFLARLTKRAVKLGVCFDLQIIAAFPTEPHDERMDGVVTESGSLVASD